MKFAEHLSAHITPEWRKQYISYEVWLCAFKYVPMKLYNIYNIECYFLKFEGNESNALFSGGGGTVIRERRTRGDIPSFCFIWWGLLHILWSWIKKDQYILLGWECFWHKSAFTILYLLCWQMCQSYFLSIAEKLAEATRKSAALQSELKTALELQQRSGKNKEKAMKTFIPIRKLRELKLAFSEFYLSLVLLQSYQNLNHTGFRKILKKHDKVLFLLPCPLYTWAHQSKFVFKFQSLQLSQNHCTLSFMNQTVVRQPAAIYAWHKTHIIPLWPSKSQ